MRESNPELHRQRVSESLIGKIGPQARRWLGDNAGYVAKHMWIVKYYGNAEKCEKCGNPSASRYEWANISGLYKRDRDDYMQLCPSCHRRMDYGNYCKRGHEFTPENTYWRKEGWRVCKICQTERFKKWKES